ncbi:MAG: TIGR03067 domain-containing protein [Pseudolabrys sp.]
MQRRTSTMCWLIISTGLVLASALPAKAAETTLQGTWITSKAEQDGKAADDLVGHRLSFMGNRFEIRSKDDKPLYAGTVQINPTANPATIDFQQKKGALNGKVWKGIYAMDGDTLTTCDNAPNLKKGRPAAFEAKSGSGYVLITFKRAKARDASIYPMSTVATYVD